MPFAGYVWPRIGGKDGWGWALRILGPPMALVASIYTALLYVEATARDVLIDTALPVLHFLYAASGEKAYAKAGSYAVGAVLGILVLQLLAYSMGFYRADVTMAWRFMLPVKTRSSPQKTTAQSPPASGEEPRCGRRPS